VVLVTCALGYVASYVVLASRGDWHASQSGRLRYSFGFAVTDIVRWQPACADWEPFRDVYGHDASRGNVLGFFYSPLIRIDRAWFHPDRQLFTKTAPPP
jgi:hypothetical protein